MKCLLCSLLCGALIGAASAANEPAAAAPASAGLPISLQGAGPYYQLNLSLPVQAGARFADLRDLKLRNRHGTALPFSWLGEEIAADLLESHGVPLFALPTPEKTATDAANVSATLHLGPNGELQLRAPRAPRPSGTPTQAAQGNEWIIDARSLRGSLIELHLALPANVEGLFPFSLQTSSDPNLREWRSAGSGQIARLKTADGQQLEQLAVPLGNLQADFIRLRFQSAQAPRINEATLISVTHAQALPALQWSAALAPERCTSTGSDQYCDYRLPHNATADSLRLQLNERNTLATLAISGLQPVDAQAYPTRRHRNPLYQQLARLRPPKATPNTPPSEREQWLSEAVVYRLQNTALAAAPPENAELSSPDITLDGGHYSHLRIRTQGAFARLGARPPSVQLGSYPKTVLFLAQGEPPYTLQWDAQTPSAELPLSKLLPQQRNDQPLPNDRATIAADAVPAPVAAIAAPAPKPSKTSGKPQPAWLWGVLAVALAVLGGMAWSLFKKKDEAPPAV